MHVMYEKNERYDFKNARWKHEKKNVTHVNPITNDA